jgi:hypothetical protein
VLPHRAYRGCGGVHLLDAEQLGMRRHLTHEQAMHNLRVGIVLQCIALLLYLTALGVYTLKAMT